MWQDQIVEEVRQAREAHAQEFDFDLWAIYADLKRIERESGLEVVSFPPKPARKIERIAKPPTISYQPASASPGVALRETDAADLPDQETGQ